MIILRKKIIFLLVLLLVITVSSITYAEDPISKGTDVVRKWDVSDHGFKDSVADIKMILVNAHGEESMRKMTMKTLEQNTENDGDKTMVIFYFPPPFKGTGVLVHTHILSPDDIWLYLPSLKRVKRVSTNNKSGPFVGSEFAFEDLGPQEFRQFKYKWLRDELCGKNECFVVEQYPQYENSGYTREIVWYEKKLFRQIRIDYYDRKNSLLKTLNIKNYRQYLNKYWRTHEMEMINHQTGKKTILTIEKWAFQTGLGHNDFTPNRLKKMSK